VFLQLHESAQSVVHLLKDLQNSKLHGCRGQAYVGNVTLWEGARVLGHGAVYGAHCPCAEHVVRGQAGLVKPLQQMIQ
jgi:hypothetical protein